MKTIDIKEMTAKDKYDYLVGMIEGSMKSDDDVIATEKLLDSLWESLTLSDTPYEFNGNKLTAHQFHTLSWLAYYYRHMRDSSNKGDKGTYEYNRGAYQALQMISMDVLKPPVSLIYEITDKNNCKGLRNYNRISNDLYWDK